MAPSPPTIHQRSEDGQIRFEVSGRWDLLATPEHRSQARSRLAALGSPDSVAWDLRGIDRLDSAGALEIWRAWGRRFPPDVRLHPYQRSIFQRLSRTGPGSLDRTSRPHQALERLGARIAGILGTLADLFLHIGQVTIAGLYTLGRPRALPWTELSATLYKAGFRAMPLVALVNFLVGLVMAFQIGLAISKYGANSAIVGVFGTAVLREIAPWVTAIIVAGRTGSAITAEIGAMDITREMLALRTLGIPPILRLALPRVAALALAVPLLVVLGSFFAILGGIVIADPTLGVAPGRSPSRAAGLRRAPPVHVARHRPTS
ncbi:MAG: ABC transporter permease, partial [Thiohalorhabdaceae bacterium]